MRVQSTTSILLVLVFPGACFHEGEVQFRGLCIQFDQATNPFQLSHAPSIFFALAQTIDNFPCTRHACRHDERKIRTPCGKRPVTAPTHDPASTGQTPRLSEDRSVAPGASRQNGSDLETSAFPRPARDAPALASRALPLVLEAQIESTLKQASALVRDHHVDRRRWQQTTDSGERSASVGNALSLDIRVSKRTIQKYMKQVRAISSPWADLENVPAQSYGRGVGL